MNYPQGTEHSQDAPWNEVKRKTEWTAWYVMVEGPDEDNHTLQLQVYFPSCCELYDARLLARAYCIDHKLGYVDIEPEEDSHYATVKTNTYYE